MQIVVYFHGIRISQHIQQTLLSLLLLFNIEAKSDYDCTNDYDSQGNKNAQIETDSS